MKTARIIAMIPVGPLAAALVASAACGSSAASDQEVAPPIQRAAAPRPPEPPLEFVGIVTTRDSQMVAAEFEGRVVRLYVHAGERVRKGQPIAKLDDSQVRKQLAGAVAAVDAARAEMGRASVEVRQAKRDKRLNSRLFIRGAVPREEIRRSEFDSKRASANYGAASAQARQAVAEREQLEQHLARATLVAPIDGVVSMIKVTEGELARPGTAVARVFDPRDLWVRFAVDNEHRSLVKEGTRVLATVPGTGASFQAVVRTISTDLEPPLQFIVADADVDDSRIGGATVGVGVVGTVRLESRAPAAAATPASNPRPRQDHP